MLTEIHTLEFSNNILSGTLPPQLHSLKNMVRASLFGNRFSGAVPSALGELTNLEVLDMGDNLLTGTVPSELGQLRRMKSFILSGED